jgi:hypothetical protein
MLPSAGTAPREPLGTVLARLRTVLQQQADALSAEDFDGLERLDPIRERLVAELSRYTAADRTPEDRVLLELVSALDQRLLALARDSMARVNHELGNVRRGRGALNEYRRRGQNVIQNLSRLDLEG